LSKDAFPTSQVQAFFFLRCRLSPLVSPCVHRRKILAGSKSLILLTLSPRSISPGFFLLLEHPSSPVPSGPPKDRRSCFCHITLCDSVFPYSPPVTFCFNHRLFGFYPLASPCPGVILLFLLSDQRCGHVLSWLVTPKIKFHFVQHPFYLNTPGFRSKRFWCLPDLLSLISFFLIVIVFPCPGLVVIRNGRTPFPRTGTPPKRFSPLSKADESFPLSSLPLSRVVILNNPPMDRSHSTFPLCPLCGHLPPRPALPTSTSSVLCVICWVSPCRVVRSLHRFVFLFLFIVCRTPLQEIEIGAWRPWVSMPFAPH